MKSLFYKVSGSPSLLGLNVNLSSDLPSEFLAMPISFQVTFQSLFPLIKLLATLHTYDPALSLDVLLRLLLCLQGPHSSAA